MNFSKVSLFSILSILIIAACSPQGGETQKKEESTGKITAFLDTILKDWEGQELFEKAYRDLTGIELEIIQPPHEQYIDKLFIQIASGELPDVCEVLPEYLANLVADGVIIPLDDFISDGKYISTVYPQYLEAVRYKDGHIYGIQSRLGGGCVTYIRKDWLLNLGLDIPADWSELLAVMRAFTFNDPDGNGLDDTVGYTDVLASSQDWYNRAVMLDAHVEIYYKDGIWVDGFTENAMRSALMRLRQIYEEGIIDRDFITNTTYSARAKFFSGQVGIFTYWANHWARNLSERTKAGAGDEAEVIPIPALKETQYINRIGPLLVITKGALDPRFVFDNFIDLQYDKGPIQTLFTYGVENYHWTESNGEVIFLLNPLDPHGGHFTRAYVPPCDIQNDWNQPMKLDPLVKPAITYHRENPYNERIKCGDNFYSNYYIEIERTGKQDIISKIVTGIYTVDEGLEEYEKEYGFLVEKILNELNGK